MTDELKAKLIDILFGAAGGISDMAEKEIAQIDQAYRDAGYLQTFKLGDKTIVLNGKDNLGYIVYYPNEVMTGQEWYERFEKGFDALIHEGDPDDATYTLDDVTYLDDFSANDILGIAERAAGIDNE